MTDPETLSAAVDAVIHRDGYVLAASLAQDRRLAGPLRDLLAACAALVEEADFADAEVEKADWRWDVAREAVIDVARAGWPTSGPTFDAVAQLFDLVEAAA